jgi:hypothetical protein
MMTDDWKPIHRETFQHKRKPKQQQQQQQQQPQQPKQPKQPVEPTTNIEDTVTRLKIAT